MAAIEYRADEFDLIEVVIDGRIATGIEEYNTDVLVSYGPQLSQVRSFLSMEAAKAWIAKNAGDLAADTQD